jgi:hypothetical protein
MRMNRKNLKPVFLGIDLVFFYIINIMKHRKRTRSRRKVSGGKRHLSSRKLSRKRTRTRRKVKGGKRHLSSRKLSRKRTRTRRKVRVGGMKFPWLRGDARTLPPVELTAEIIKNIALANAGNTGALDFLTKKIEELNNQIKTGLGDEKNELTAMRKEIDTQLEIAKKNIAGMSKRQRARRPPPSSAALKQMTDEQLESLKKLQTSSITRHMGSKELVKGGYDRIKTAAQAAAAIEETNRLQQEELAAMWTAVQEEPDIVKKKELEKILKTTVEASVPDRQRTIVAAEGEGAARTKAEDDAAAHDRQMRAEMAAQGRWADGTLRDPPSASDRNAAAEAAAQPEATEADREEWVDSVLAAPWALNEIEKTTLAELKEIVKKYRPGGVKYKSRKVTPDAAATGPWDDLLARHALERRELRERQDKEQAEFRKPVPQSNDPFELRPDPFKLLPVPMSEI